ncbi:MAG: hypothetical protein AVDCRST_MAG88-3124, partial [uncultured Thermomicrobiales bacterium]
DRARPAARRLLARPRRRACRFLPP